MISIIIKNITILTSIVIVVRTAPVISSGVIVIVIIGVIVLSFLPIVREEIRGVGIETAHRSGSCWLGVRRRKRWLRRSGSRNRSGSYGCRDIGWSKRGRVWIWCPG